MRSLIFTLCFLFIIISANAQVYKGSEADKIVKGSNLVNIDENSKTINHICFQTSGTRQQILQDGKEFLKNTLSLPSDFGLMELNTTEDNFGIHVKYQFTYKGIPIEDYVYGIQKEEDQIISANGYYKILKEDNSSKLDGISEEEALESALNFVKAKTYQWEIDENFTKSKAEFYYIEKNRALILVYKFDIYSAVPLSRQFVYINAETGEVEKTVDQLHIYTNDNGTAITKYQGTKTIKTDYNGGAYRLRENSRGNGIETYDLNNGTSYSAAVDFIDADNYWSTTTNQDDAANDAHYGAEATYDYYFTKFGRNSIDGSGFALKSYVHYSSGYVNAFWNGSYMTYGDGDGSSYTALTSIDVCGHEITHGLTSNTANLNYSYESGALNESFSDIFGVAIDFYANPATANYLMGDQISVSGTPFRSMINPNLYSQPDTYLGTYWWTSSGDNGGVHYNSGVQNFWFYLLCVGGSGTNDIGHSFVVNSIGMNKAAAIAYRTLTVYLTPTSQYADARYYSIQAAIDLYGECSSEVINVTNAWYAVGVGAAYSNSVIADFTLSQNYSCTIPATIYFTNKSTNATNYLWNFGDGNTSTLANPSHIYSSTGSYTVTLISSGTSYCNNTDTLILSNPIIVTNVGGPITPSCAPGTVNSSGAYGILNFTFNGINNNTSGAADGFKDFSCNFLSTLTEGINYHYSATLGTSSAALFKMWIDLNNDGQFNNTDELLVNASNVSTTKAGTINIPHPTIYNTPLRLRIASDMNSGSYLTTACTNSQYGQYEDYSVKIQQNTNPPDANFVASNTTINLGQSVSFSDSSQNLPTSWIWTFSGGTPSLSTLQNPVITYSTLGTYTVKLKVQNIYGLDSLERTSYIHVVNTYNMCSTTSTTSASGTLYDSGGPTGDYQDYENCSFLIDPGCASSITLSFVAFNIESGYDYFTVYNGTSSSGTQLLRATGSTLPSSVTATSGKMFITFTTDYSVVRSGFQANWTSVIPASNPPVADFSISDTNPPLNTNVQFTDLSTNSPNTWLWNFGDGTTSALKTPTHSFNTSGSKSITLTASNCYGPGSKTKDLIVQSAPEINVSPASFTEVIHSCDDSISTTLIIKNTGTGSLNWNWPGFITSVSDDFDPGVDTAVWQNITGGVAANTCGSYSSPNSLYFNGSSTREAITIPIKTTGGGVITFYLEISNGNAPCEMADAGENVILSYSNNGGSTWVIIRTYLTGSYNTFTAISETIPDGAKTNLTLFKWSQPSHSGLGYDNWSIDNVSISSSSNAFYSLSPESGTIASNDSTEITVKIKSTGLKAGAYNDSIIINSNDPLAPVKKVNCALTIFGAPEMALSDTCFHFGNLFRGLNLTDTLMIFNTGCDTLKVTNITCSLNEYTVDKTNFEIAPGDSGTVNITFTPNSSGSFNGNLSIYSNDVDTVMCLSGSGVEPPIIAISPSSLNATITGCNDSITLPMTIYNIGGNDLIFEIEGNSTRTVELLALTYGVDYDEEYQHTLTAINQYFTDYHLTEINTTSAAALQSALSGKDVLLIAEQEVGSASVFTGFASVIQSFANNGGTVIFCGTYTSGCVFNTGLFTGIYYITASGTLNVINTTHPITYQVLPAFSALNATYSYNITNADANRLIGYNTNYDIVTCRNFGKGKAVYIAFDYYAYDNNAAHIIANAVKWGSKGSLPSWMDLSVFSDTIPAGDSTVLTLKFNSSGLDAGVYNDSITIHSNDPLKSTKKVACSLAVIGTPEMVCSDTCFHFGNVFHGLSKTDTLLIFSTGCDTLHVSNITSSLIDFSVDRTNMEIAPGDTGTVHITFTPSSASSFNGNLTIYSDDVNTGLCLSGIGVKPPAITISPVSLNATITGCNDSINMPMTISNKGGCDLTFDILQTITISDDFDPGIDNSFWQSVTGGVAANSCGYYSAPNSLYFNGSSTRDAITKPVNASAGGNIKFYLEISSGSSPCEMADYGENVILSYSTNGGSTWVIIQTYLTGSYTSFTSISETIPAGARTNATLFKWSQPVNSGLGCDNWSIDNVSISIVPNRFYSLSPTSGTCTPGDSIVINVKFNSTGLNAGLHNDSIIINSNDPINPKKTVDCNLTVINTAKMALSDTCYLFGNVFKGLSKKDTLLIFNTGCYPLLINNITSSLNEFTVDMNDMAIESGDTGIVYIIFSPSSAGSFNGSLIILSNDVDSVLCLSGIGVEPPLISNSPDSLNAYVSECNDSVTLPLTIYNDGGSDLIFKIENENSNNKLTTTFAAGNGSKGNMFNIHAVSTITIDKFDIHLNGTLTYPVEIYYRQGGYEGHETSASDWTLLLSTSVTGKGLNNPTPVTISGLTIPSGETYGLYINSPNGDLKYTNGSKTYSDYNITLQAGAGLGATFGTIYTPRTWNGSVYYTSKNLPGWLTVSTVSDTIVPGDSIVMGVHFNSLGLNAGNFYSNFSITSNDLDTPQLSVPVHFLVSTTPYQPSVIIGDTIVYTGIPETYSVTNIPGVAYNWIATGGIISGSGNSVSVTWNAAGIQVLTVTPSNECGDGLTQTLNVTVGTEPTIPDEIEVADITVSSGEIICFNAIDTITVAGGGTIVEFLSGSTVELIAGGSIFLLPGFHANEGSLTHAYITTDSTFCDGVSGITIVDQPADKSIEEKPLPEKQAVVPGEKSVKVYPNPNNGQFTLELTNIESGATVCIYNLLGESVYKSKAKNQDSHKVNLPYIKRGIYFVKVMDGKEQFTRKMVVN